MPIPENSYAPRESDVVFKYVGSEATKQNYCLELVLDYSKCDRFGEVVISHV